MRSTPFYLLAASRSGHLCFALPTLPVLHFDISIVVESGFLYFLEVFENKFFGSAHAVVATSLIDLVRLSVKNNEFKPNSISAAQPGLLVENVKILHLPFPRIEEQAAIVAYIEKETARINAKLENTKKLIHH